MAGLIIFRDASTRMKLAFFSMNFGFWVFVFAYQDGLYLVQLGGKFAIDCVQIGLVCFVVAVCLITVQVVLGIFRDDRQAQILYVGYAFTAGVATLIGMAIYSSTEHWDNALNLPIKQGVLGCLLAIVSAGFVILEMVKPKRKPEAQVLS